MKLNPKGEGKDRRCNMTKTGQKVRGKFEPRKVKMNYMKSNITSTECEISKTITLSINNINRVHNKM